MLCCFGYYQKIIPWIIGLKIYVIQDVINSNLVLIMLTLYRSSVQNIFECAKIVKWSVSQILFGNETYLKT